MKAEMIVDERHNEEHNANKALKNIVSSTTSHEIKVQSMQIRKLALEENLRMHKDQ